ncbi:MAG: aspartate/glutamate racemase family protein [Pseudomonadales bacterium]|nr:aspartate/glutamate racemase family protein [Pseudomonadales bacterium]
MTTEIRLCVPLTTVGLRREEDVEDLGGADVHVSVRMLERGPASIESHVDEVLAVPDLLRIGMEAQAQGVDAMIVDCMGDPGVEAARELLDIPVFGPAQVAMHIAGMLGHRFCVVTVLERLHPLIEDLARRYGVDSIMARPRSVEIPVLEIDNDPDQLVGSFIQKAAAAVRDDEVDVIVFGCTGFYGMTEKIEQGLADMGLAGVPVIDPIPVSVEVVAGLLRQGICHSKHGFQTPPQKDRPGFELGN